jgi:hypothetical protein
VASVTLTDAGLYTVAPTNPVAQGSSSGSGTGATFTLTTSSANFLSNVTGGALWTALGATSYMATAMVQKNGTDLANYIGSTALANAIQASLPIVPPQGYLTLTSLTPIIAADVIGVSTIYYTPYVGNLIPIYNGTFFIAKAFSELTMTLNNPNHASGGLYDIFVFLNAGVVTIATGPVWTNSTPGSCARGTGAGTTELQLLNGIQTNKNVINLRNDGTTYNNIAANQATYVGTTWIDTTAGQTTCHRTLGQNRKWGVWNLYNQTDLYLLVNNPGTWVYNTNAVRASNGAPATYSAAFYNVGSGTTCIGFTVLMGLAQTLFDVRFNQNVTTADNGTQTGDNAQAFIGIGVNSVTAATGKRGIMGGVGSAAVASAQGFYGNPVAELTSAPVLGLTNIQGLEVTAAATNSNVTYNGSDMILKGQWRG